MTKETNLNIVPVALLRMEGYPVQLMDQFRIPGKELSCASFINEAFVIRKKLREFIKKNKDIQEAIWISSEKIYSDLEKKFRDIKENEDRKPTDRRWEILTIKYLLRFCYKNDRTSFFGPSCYVCLSNLQSSSIEGVIKNEIANRENTDTYVASWAHDVSAKLLYKYNKARGVKEKSAILEKITSEVTGKSNKTHWKWYNERSPVYELCPANVNITIGGELLRNITNQSIKIGNKFRIFNAMMYETAVKNGFYSILYSEVHKQIKSNRLEDWFNFFYLNDLSFLNDIKEKMIGLGKRLFQQVFLEDNYYLGNYEEPLRQVMPLFFSPDIMISSPSLKEINKGNYKLIIGDMHGSLTSFYKPPSFYYNNIYFKKSIGLLNKSVFNNINFYFPKNLVPNRFDFPESFKVKKNIKNINLCFKNGEIYLDNPKTYVEFFYSDILAKIIPLGTFHLEQFFPEIQDRIVVDDIILKRRSYIMKSKEYLNIMKSYTNNSYKQWYFLFNQTKKFFNQKGFQDIVFIKPDSEYKPIAIDINNPFCCEMLEIYAKRSNSINIQEMFPEKNSLWLGNDKGNYTSELRLSFYKAIK